jgi:hypothetical protein
VVYQPVQYLNHIITPVYQVVPYPNYVLYPNFYANSSPYPTYQTVSNPANINQQQISQQSSIKKTQDQTKIQQLTTENSKPTSNSAAVTGPYLDGISNLPTNTV